MRNSKKENYYLSKVNKNLLKHQLKYVEQIVEQTPNSITELH